MSLDLVPRATRRAIQARIGSFGASKASQFGTIASRDAAAVNSEAARGFSAVRRYASPSCHAPTPRRSANADASAFVTP